ncbi:MAG: recombinase family protein [Defluviitaleaceae bacterium]|nr:recombinase family protein [Defluviitaleaceae bacterium]
MDKLRVTAYCRVSTDKDDQLNSLANQEKYFISRINEQPEWEYVPLYIDEGLSGTSTKKRVNFNKMITDAHKGLFDIILTKEVSRFARNTVDTLQHTRALKEIGISVIFTSDNIDSRDGDGELRLAIMASIAQDESRRTSERVKFGHKRSMENGVIFGQKMLGYDREGKGRNAKLIINKSEAESVRIIFKKYLVEGKGLTAIARELEAEHIQTGYGKQTWDATSVQRILSNEKYAGDLTQGKFHTPNYLSQDTKRNKNKDTYIVRQNTHPPIIDRDTFDKTQQELARRSTNKKSGSRHTSRYPFSGKLVCGLCGSIFINRNTRTSDKNKKEVKRWRCAKSFKYGADETKGGCPAKMVRQEILEEAFLTALNDMVQYKDELIKESMNIVMGVLDTEQIRSDQENIQKKIAKLENRIKRLIDLRLDGEITKEEMQTQKKPLDGQITVLNNQLIQLDKTAEQVTERETFIDTIKTHISGIVKAETFDGETVKETLEKIIIHDKATFDVYFKGCGKESLRVCSSDDGGICPHATKTEGLENHSFFVSSSSACNMSCKQG